MMKRCLSLALLSIAAAAATAADTATALVKPLGLKPLRALYGEIVKPIDATRLWFKKPQAARMAAERDSDALILRVEKVFGESPEGPAAACRDAAIRQRMYIAALNNLSALAEGHGQPAALDLLAAMHTAVGYGQASADCRRYLETLLPEGKTLEAPTKTPG